MKHHTSDRVRRPARRAIFDISTGTAATSTAAVALAIAVALSGALVAPPAAHAVAAVDKAPPTGADAKGAPALETQLFPVNPDDGVVGEHRVHVAKWKDTLLDIARRFSMGLEEMRLANPDVDMWIPGEGTEVQLPLHFVLPNAPREGIVINVPEMRAYYYPDDPSAPIRTWPISIGRDGWDTPLGTTKIVRKKRRPTWYPPESIREEHAARGDPLPRVVAPGPDNPLGTHALYLGLPAYLIHGTNRPYSIGMRVSHGCVRMYPEHIVDLFGIAEPGTPVTLVHQTVKAGWAGDELYLEVHPVADVEPERARPRMTETVRAIIAATSREKDNFQVDWERIGEALTVADGMPVVVARRTAGGAEAQGTMKGAAGSAPTTAPRVGS